jgi:hypothetical protein
MRWVGYAAGASLIAVAACSLTSLDGLAGGEDPASPAEAGADVVAVEAGEGGRDPLVDGGAEGGADGASLASPVTVVANTGVAFGAGGAQQTHLHYASNAKRWVLFYLDSTDTTRLKTRTSADFVTWTDGAAMVLPEPHPGDGRDLAVSYSDLAARDVFHVSVSLQVAANNRSHFHARATMTSNVLVFEPAVELGRTAVSNGAASPDGPAVARLAGGKVVDMSGFWTADGGVGPTGNLTTWVSNDVETGGTWSPAFTGPVMIESVNEFCNARQLLTTTTGALALWEKGDVEPSPTNVQYATFDGASWKAPASVGFKATSFDPNDWSAAYLADTTTHAVRFAGGAFEHRIFDGFTWSAGQAIPPLAVSAGRGVVVLPDGFDVAVLVVGATIRETSFHANAWSPWHDVVAAGPTRSGLGGYSGPGGVAVVWVEAKGTQQDIVAARLR